MEKLVHLCWFSLLCLFALKNKISESLNLLVGVFVMQAKFRSSSWWIRFFIQTSLEENEAANKKFEQAAKKQSYRPACQVFHLKPLQ